MPVVRRLVLVLGHPHQAGMPFSCGESPVEGVVFSSLSALLNGLGNLAIAPVWYQDQDKYMSVSLKTPPKRLQLGIILINIMTLVKII